VDLPPQMLSKEDSEVDIQAVAEQLWRIKPEDQLAPLAVLTALCDSVVWWTQRLKPGRGGDD
jgi:hypothetical protein